jgi:hypothetical protein
VRLRQRMCMLDWTEALLRPGGDFSDVREQAVGAGTVDATDFLNRIQIGQASSIENQIVSAPNLRDSVNRKADELIDGDEKVEEQKRNYTSVNWRHRRDDQDPRISDMRPKSELFNRWCSFRVSREIESSSGLRVFIAIVKSTKMAA